MIDPNHTTDDAPAEWDRYADLLRAQPAPALSRERSAELLASIHTTISAPPKKLGWTSRWVLVPAASVITAVVVLLLASISAPEQAPQSKAGAPAVVRESQERPRQQRRPARNRLPEPSIPATPLPAAVDSAVLPKTGPIPPLVDPVGPGGSRAPRSTAARQGTSPAHPSAAQP